MTKHEFLAKLANAREWLQEIYSEIPDNDEAHKTLRSKVRGLLNVTADVFVTSSYGTLEAAQRMIGAADMLSCCGDSSDYLDDLVDCGWKFSDVCREAIHGEESI